jgi:predicted ATPase
MASSNGKRVLRFTHLHLENWRNFAEVDVDLQARVFLVGPNASGKSNLLDALRFLHDIASVGGGLQEAVQSGRRGGVKSLRCLAARSNPQIAVSARIGTSQDSALWEYELRFSQDSQRRPVIKKERVARDGEDIRVRPDEDDKKDPERLTQTHLEQVGANKEFREVAEFLAAVNYLHIVPQLIREPDRSVGRRDDPFGGDFLERVARTPKKTQEARLRKIGKALAVAVPQLSELHFFRDMESGTPHLRGRYEHWRPHGAWQNEDQFSDGTLRLLGLLWAMLDGGGPLLLEEPELSLHPEVIRSVPQMIARTQQSSRRQVAVSTHSFDLLRDPGIGLDEVLLLSPEGEGTAVTPASSIRQVRVLLESGMTMAEAVIPRTSPKDARQLTLFASS